MMRSFVVTALLVAACEQPHQVEILLGPDRETLSDGFACVTEETPREALVARGGLIADPEGGFQITFSIVVDFIAVGGGLPGCRGEEIRTWCERHTCAPVPSARSCKEITIRRLTTAIVAEGGDALKAFILDQAYTQLGTEPVTERAPDGTVIIRAVATDQSCAAVTGDTPEPFDTSDTSTTLMGCAYSCPVVLDNVDGTIQLSLDTSRVDILGRQLCEPEVRACAGDLRAVGSD
jgi:hypothetical protein